MIRHGARPRPWAGLTIGVLTLACTRPDNGQAVAGGDTVPARSVDPAPAPRADPAESSFSYGCADEYRLSGWPYEATVWMTLNGREYRGCGRWL